MLLFFPVYNFAGALCSLLRKAGAAAADAQTIALMRLGSLLMSDVNYQQRRHRIWRERVLRKAGYLCQECARYGRRTEATVAHHIKHADEYPELRYDVRNGRALCAACHNKEHPEKGGSHS